MPDELPTDVPPPHPRFPDGVASRLNDICCLDGPLWRPDDVIGAPHSLYNLRYLLRTLLDTPSWTLNHEELHALGLADPRLIDKCLPAIQRLAIYSTGPIYYAESHSIHLHSDPDLPTTVVTAVYSGDIDIPNTAWWAHAMGVGMLFQSICAMCGSPRALTDSPHMQTLSAQWDAVNDRGFFHGTPPLLVHSDLQAQRVHGVRIALSVCCYNGCTRCRRGPMALDPEEAVFVVDHDGLCSSCWAEREQEDEDDPDNDDADRDEEVHGSAPDSFLDPPTIERVTLAIYARNLRTKPAWL